MWREARSGSPSSACSRPPRRTLPSVPPFVSERVKLSGAIHGAFRVRGRWGATVRYTFRFGTQRADGDARIERVMAAALLGRSEVGRDGGRRPEGSGFHDAER